MASGTLEKDCITPTSSIQGNIMSHALIALREKMRSEQIDILLMPHNDRFKSEYIPASEERLAWISNFTGSWGFAIITQDEAILFVDGRYTLQAPQQTDPAFWTIKQVPQDNPHAVLKSLLRKDKTVAIETTRFTLPALLQWQNIIHNKEAHIILRDDDLLDGLWHGRPASPDAPAFAHDITYAGRDTDDKLRDLDSFFESHTLDGYIVSDPGQMCWLLNMRGRDISHMPIALGMGFITADKHIMLFIDAAKIPDTLKAQWGSLVTIHPLSDMQDVLIQHSAQRIGYDGSHCAAHLILSLKDKGKEAIDIVSPLELARAIKNETEINGSRNAHKRDALAVIETWYWIDTHAKSTTLSELDIVDYLHHARAQQDLFIEDSFATIAGSGPNGAIIHYRATENTNHTLDHNSMLLLDSGGQYRDGTTDITRTFAIGTPPHHMIADYTAVLQGHINLTTTRFPHGTSGAVLDVLSRVALWQDGRNFAHGTGHGIGSFMGVHEGPQGFSPRAPHPLHAGMLITNEPGYYKEDHYGIRLENVVVVVDDVRDGDELPMLALDYLTLVPFDAALVDVTRLSPRDKDWLRTYHADIIDQIMPLVGEPIRTWLQHKCDPFLAL
jgi:Xaa-Pro aminopeptidase